MIIIKRTLALTIILIFLCVTILTGCMKVASKETEVSIASETPAASVQPANSAAKAVPSAQPLIPSYVSIDINPSIQLTVVGGIVTEAKAFNDDGAEILSDYGVIGMSTGDAAKTLVKAFAANGYIASGSEAAIVITAAGGNDKELLDDLKENTEEDIESLGIPCKVVASPVSEEIVQTAQNCGLSTGRYLLIKSIAEKENISFDDALVNYGKMKMSELIKKIGDVDGLLDDIDDTNNDLSSLTADQLKLLEDARTAYKTSMKDAQSVFNDARNSAQDAYKKAISAAKSEYAKDKTKEKAAVKAAQSAFSKAKNAAKDKLKAAINTAKDTFTAAIASLGLDSSTIDSLLDWHFNTGFNYGDNQEGENQDAQDEDNNDQGKDEDVQGGDNDEQGKDEDAQGDDNDDQSDNHDKGGNKDKGGSHDKSGNQDDQGEDDDQGGNEQ